MKTNRHYRVNSTKWREVQYKAKTKLLHQILEKIVESSAKVKNLKIVMKRSKATISEHKSVLEAQEKKRMCDIIV